jgi:hypothetical protein
MLNSRFGDYLHLIYPNELEVKDTTDLEIDNAGRLIIKLYDKRDDFNKHNIQSDLIYCV